MIVGEIQFVESWVFKARDFLPVCTEQQLSLLSLGQPASKVVREKLFVIAHAKQDLEHREQYDTTLNLKGQGPGALIHTLKLTDAWINRDLYCTCDGADQVRHVCCVIVQYWCGRHHECGLERVERALPVQPGYQPAGDYPLLEAQHGRRGKHLAENQADSITLLKWCGLSAYWAT